MGYQTKLETYAAVRVMLPEGHPIECYAGLSVTFGPYPDAFTERDVLQKALEDLQGQQRKAEELIAKGLVFPSRDSHDGNKYLRAKIALAQELLAAHEDAPLPGLRMSEAAVELAQAQQVVEKVRQMRDVQIRYFAATAEDRAAAKMEKKHWMWKPKGSLAPELLKLSKQLEGEVDILLSQMPKGGEHG